MSPAITSSDVTSSLIDKNIRDASDKRDYGAFHTRFARGSHVVHTRFARGEKNSSDNYSSSLRIKFPLLYSTQLDSVTNNSLI
jgi:hypothetical protein